MAPRPFWNEDFQFAAMSAERGSVWHVAWSKRQRLGPKAQGGLGTDWVASFIHTQNIGQSQRFKSTITTQVLKLPNTLLPCDDLQKCPYLKAFTAPASKPGLYSINSYSSTVPNSCTLTTFAPFFLSCCHVGSFVPSTALQASSTTTVSNPSSSAPIAVALTQ